MAEEERTKERLENKIKKRDYTGYDDDEFAEGNQGLMKRSILAKYDEDIEGSRHSVNLLLKFIENHYSLTRSVTQEFRLGSSATLSSQSKHEEQKQQVASSLNKTLLTIDYASKYTLFTRRFSPLTAFGTENLSTADYLQEGDVGFKKPKVNCSYSIGRAELTLIL